MIDRIAAAVVRALVVGFIFGLVGGGETSDYAAAFTGAAVGSLFYAFYVGPRAFPELYDRKDR